MLQQRQKTPDPGLGPTNSGFVDDMPTEACDIPSPSDERPLRTDHRQVKTDLRRSWRACERRRRRTQSTACGSRGDWFTSTRGVVYAVAHASKNDCLRTPSSAEIGAFPASAPSYSRSTYQDRLVSTQKTRGTS